MLPDKNIAESDSFIHGDPSQCTFGSFITHMEKWGVTKVVKVASFVFLSLRFHCFYSVVHD